MCMCEIYGRQPIMDGYANVRQDSGIRPFEASHVSDFLTDTPVPPVARRPVTDDSLLRQVTSSWKVTKH